MYNYKKFSALILAAAVLSGCSMTENVKENTEKPDSEAMSLSENKIADAEIVFSDSISCSGKGVSANGNEVTVSSSGRYVLSGKSDNAAVIVNASDSDEITLVLNGLELTSADNSPLRIISAKDVYIELADGTENTLSDGESYSDDFADGCIFSKSDIHFEGNGILNVNGNFKHGIVSKDDIEISSGIINVSSVSTGIDGKDSVEIEDGEITVNAGTNGIRSDNTEKEDKGNVTVKGGKVTVVSGGDSIDAANTAEISGGELVLTSGGGCENSASHNFAVPDGFDFSEMTPPDDGKNPVEMPDGMTPPDNGKIPDEMPDGMTPPDNGKGFRENRQGGFGMGGRDNDFDDFYDDTDENAVSAKGIKAGKALLISTGKITVNSSDDALHSGGNADISGGDISVNTGDDGIHADENISVDSAVINIMQSYEGIEGKVIDIKGGAISVVSSDDAVNCTDGSTSQRGMFDVQEGVRLNISDGEIVLSSFGDGIDSNGDFIMSGGNVYVSGPDNGGNGALDINGKAEISGGSIIAAGAVGMEMGFSDSSSQYSVLHNLSGTVAGGEKISVTDSAGQEILSFSPDKMYQSIVFSSPLLKENESYTITAGEFSESITITGTVTSDSDVNSFMRR